MPSLNLAQVDPATDSAFASATFAPDLFTSTLFPATSYSSFFLAPFSPAPASLSPADAALSLSTSAVPEPTSLALLALATTSLLPRRRRIKNS